MTTTPASQWKRPTEEHDLPSGRVVLLRRVDPIEVIMRDGNIPGSLSGFIAQAMNGKQASLNIAPQDAGFMPELAGRVCKAAFVQPRIVDMDANYEAGEILLDDVDFQDKMDVFSWAFSVGGQRQAAEAFPVEQNGRVPAA